MNALALAPACSTSCTENGRSDAVPSAIRTRSRRGSAFAGAAKGAAATIAAVARARPRSMRQVSAPRPLKGRALDRDGRGRLVARVERLDHLREVARARM